MLIGATTYGHLLLYDVKKYGKNHPIMQETELGWIVSGACKEPQKRSKKTEIQPRGATSLFMSTTDRGLEYDNLSEQIKHFWAMEDINNNKRMWSPEEKEAENHYVNNTRQDEHARVIVRLPFKKTEGNGVELGNSLKMALTRFLQLEKRLIKIGKHDEFVRAIQDFVDANHMREATNKESAEGIGYFVPVQVVFKETSETTKVRPVFDASAKSSNGKSMNDYMMVGPTIQQDLFSVLTSWRKHKIAMTADIEKMYRQIRIDDRDVVFQKILFRENVHERLKQYVISTVMFGNSAAPFLAIRTLHKIADEIEHKQPHIAKMIRSQFYVDDLFSGGETPTQALEHHKSITTALASHGLPLRKWSTNSLQLQQLINGEQGAEKIEIKFDTMQKALGISWSPAEDNFVFKFTLPTLPGRLTKRMLSSDLMKLFDPLGWLAPTIVMGKLIAQKTWTVPSLGWDDWLPDVVESAWRT